MDRKSFLRSGLTIIAGSTVGGRLHARDEPSSGSEIFSRKIIPPSLRPGDTIGITTPAGYMALDEMQPAIRQIQDWGFKVKLGTTIGKCDGVFGGTASERITDFNQMLRDDTIKAILCARGGYGIVGIIDQMDFSHFRKNPKWIIGFSDVTVLHCHINRNYRVATLHSKMCNSFPNDWNAATTIQQQAILSIKDALEGKKKMSYNAVSHPSNRSGECVGELIGGNLRTIENLAATRSDIITKKKILFVEDTQEPLYNIDRMFWSLKRTGKLESLSGLIIGGFKIKPEEDTAHQFPHSLYDIVSEKVKEYSFPVCFDFPVGHQIENFALKCGVKHQLIVTDKQTVLKELY